MTRRSTRSCERSPKSAWSSFPLRSCSTRFARSIRRSSKRSTASCDPAPPFPGSRCSVFRQILATLEDLLDLAVDLFETERQLGGYRVDAAIDADGLHALQELDVEEGLRCGGFLKEGFVEGERVERPLHDSFELRLREEIRLAQDVDERQAVSELDRGVQQDGSDEAAGALHERWIVEIDERGVLAPECIDQDRTGSAEREELDLAWCVDQVIVRRKGLQDVRQ